MSIDSLFFIIALGAIVAGFVQGLSGFAFGMVAMSFWAWKINPELVVAMAVFGALTGQILVAATVRRKFHLKVLFPFLIGGLVGVPIGVVVLPYLDINRFKSLLGFILVIWCPLMLITNRLPRIKMGGRVADSTVGGLGGIMSGLGGVAGVIPTLWCILRGFDKDTQRAVIQNFNLAMLLVTMITYISTGIVTSKMIPIFTIIAFSMLIPVYIGNRLYNRISEPLLEKLF
ncbi:MAG: sulfite exporter TauE/SafE family protein [Legionellaceae bacterium]|nr:sulfite exporter TauE/SafE family protein [Legionellaceae bacterium]